ncbi:[protein-PII] uridylyltransferase [Friedmanniella endophytica]|uniref:Bifunctional uridylyltransferase/uridylyl-removing enzyme n=1 Tax=Microlunatus kandeliicorticis TaxID=1759536 RepID=A0A7W3IV95_9ACTN|nr:[protein-PII] uridylyltransferase [Microlunatus kandeliicorticis]
MMEEALEELWAEAGGPTHGVGLACVGSLARRELGPRSDLDLVLVHDGRTAGVEALAERLWYPLWDSRVRLDHAVRTPAECASIAGSELSAGVGLLDLRPLAGDRDLVGSARTALLASWRNGARKRLPELLDSIDERRRTFGDAAYLLEPDLKEARGGFRDMSTLRALAATWLTDLPHGLVTEPYHRLLDVRDALHVTAGRTLDRLLATEVDEVAARLGYPDGDELHRYVSLAARRIGYAVDLTARAARQVLPVRRVISFARRERKPVLSEGPHGLIVHAGEVGLGQRVSVADPLLGLRAAAYAAREGLVLSPVTAENLGRALADGTTPPLPDPWPAEALEALLELLSAGRGLLGPWEALELNRCIGVWLPDWTSIRAKPQHNPIHRHTVDRHSVQTVVECAPFLTAVERPDLLLLAALFHDIGKATAGRDHPAVGAPVARAAVLRLGLSAEDADVVALLVREHLALADLATHRDHTDPATAETLATAVGGRAENLRLLRALTEADARAAGPAAWSPWRAQLIDALADRVLGRLTGAERPAPAQTARGVRLAAAVAGDGRPRVEVEPVPGGVELVAAERDRVGLFGDMAGLLAAHQVTVRSGSLTTEHGIAVNTWRLEVDDPADLPPASVLQTELQRLAEGDHRVLQGVRRRDLRNRAGAPTPFVAALPGASETAAVLEVRAGDRSGLLWALGEAVAGIGLNLRSAHVSTLAGQAIDTLYLTEPDGRRPDDDRVAEAITVVRAAAGLPEPDRQATTATADRHGDPITAP